MMLFLLAGLFLVTSCKDDDEPEEAVKYEVTQATQGANQVIVSNQTPNAACLWEWFKEGIATPMGTSTSNDDTINFAFAGTYTVRITVALTAGTESKETTIVVAQDDLTLFSNPLWTKLTGGPGQEKQWVLDIEGKYLPGPLSFLGTSWDFVEKKNANQDDAWSWDAGTDFTFELTSEEGWKKYKNLRMELPEPDGYGVMKFNLIGDYNFIADKKKEDPETGTFSMDISTMTLTLTGGTILRSYKPHAAVKDDPSCEGDDCAVHEADGIVGISDWQNYKIYQLTDTLLRLAVSRDQDVQGEGVCWLIYNFVEKNLYDNFVPEQFTYSESVKTSFTQADLVGTWKYAAVPQGWIAYNATGDKGTNIPAHLFGKWDTREQVVSDITSWGAGNVDSVFTANSTNTYVFNNDGTCTLNGVANTYTVANGVITFGTALTNEFSLVWLTLTGTELKVIDVQYYGDNVEAYTPLGIWIGQKNGSKDEYSAVQLVKQ